MHDASHINALDGIAFATDLSGVIQHVGEANWNAFAAENGAADLQAETVLGRSLFDFIEGARVRHEFQRVLSRISTDPNWSWVLPFRCDAPDRMRQMCQSLRPIFSGRVCTGYLFHTVEMHSKQRPPLGLFDFKRLAAQREQSPDLPTVLMCSWCQRVHFVPLTGAGWVNAEAYYAAGGKSDVQLSHSICEDCLDTTSDPFIADS